MDRRRYVIAGVLVVVGLAVGAAVLVARTGGLGPWRWGTTPSTEFPAAAECATCHPVAAAEWRTSAHARAGSNVLVHASVCGPCHAPVGTQLDPEYVFKVTSGSAVPDMPASAAEGVTCVVCHATTHGPAEHILTFIPVWPNWRTTDLALRLSPFDTALGPFGSAAAGDPPPVANTSHESQADPRLTQSDVCRPCHDVTFDKGPLAAQAGGPQPLVHLLTTYQEWAASDYPKAGKTCQTCHMPRRTDTSPAAVAPPGVKYDRPLPLRVHADHSTLGVDTAYWDKDAPVELQARQAAAHLKGAATVEIDVPPTVAPGSTMTVTVTMRNVGVGHDLMSGFSFWREAWLEVVVTDAAERGLLASGRLDEDGWLPDEFSPRVRQDPRLYDPYLVQLRTRLVSSPANVAAWLRPDRTVAVPPEAIKRNLNGTPVLSWAQLDVKPIVARLERAAGRAPTAPSPLEEVYVLRYAEALIREGIPAGGTRQARYPVLVDAAATGPLRVSARLLLRAMGRQMTQQQEEIADDPPIKPVYEIGTGRATVTIAGK